VRETVTGAAERKARRARDQSGLTFYQAEYVVENAVHGNDRSVEYPGTAHTVFDSPQVASLGKTEGD